MFHPRYPIETAWDPALDAFRTKTGADFARMIEAARKNAPTATRRRTFRKSSSFLDLPFSLRRKKEDASSPLLLAVDIVRIPVLPKKQLRPVLARLRGQLRTLEGQGWPLAVWEIRELPKPADTDAWAKTCFKAFRRPPILMLGWRLSKGRIQPDPDRMKHFLERWADKAHSIILTGEELNTQFYAPENGGKALAFLDYWIGVIRTLSPETFVWCRIDEVLKRKNARNETWLEHFLPLTDGVNYQVAFGPGDLAKDISKQFGELSARKRKLERRNHRSVPLFVGGFTHGFPSRPGASSNRDRTNAIQRMTGRAAAFVRRLGLLGCVRFVGLLPEQPNKTLFGASPVPDR